jgi:glucose-1-phosphate adenylyltransferase
MVDAHIASGAGVTVAGIRVPRTQAEQFGVIEPGPDGEHIARFREKPSDPEGLADDPESVFASMGNYVFTTEALIEAVTIDAADEASNHDIGGDVMPSLVSQGEARVYDFAENRVSGTSDRDRAYWRDVGTLDAYYEANMDLVSVHPVFNLYNDEWPILTWTDPMPPAKFVSTEAGEGRAVDSMICQDVIISGGVVRRSILSPGVRVRSWATVEDSVIMHGVQVGRHAVVRRAIVDKNVVIPEGARIGVDLDLDRERFAVSEGGIVVIGKGQKVA